TLDDVDERYVGDLLFDDALRGGRSDVSSADHGHFELHAGDLIQVGRTALWVVPTACLRMNGPMNSELFGRATTRRPEYKSHPLWIEAMSLTREAYALSERLRTDDPERSFHLRKAAVAVPAHVASALSAEPAKRAEPMHAARAALAAVSDHAARTRDPW